MTNMIESAKKQAQELIEEGYRAAVSRGALPDGVELKGNVEIPKDEANGDYASNSAMTAAKTMRMAPRTIATEIISGIDLNGTYFSSVEVAGAGFINFRLGQKWYGDVISGIETDGEDYGKSNVGKGEKVMVEFVSANPTGPMHIGNARGGVLGDTLASVLQMAGYNVSREFYVNDAGNQVDLFGRSIEARYLQICLGEENVPFPDNGYHGDDIKALAREIYERDGDKYLNVDETQRREAFISYGLPKNIEAMKRDLERYRIHFDTWFLESSLHESGAVRDTVELLKKNGLTYEKDGAVWLKNTELGADKDEVLQRSNGFYTYYAVDIAYHINKFAVRGFDRVIDVWGADHHGHAIRFKATCSAPCIPIDQNKLDFLIMQMVRLTRNGETIKVSKRTGKALGLSDLLDEISVDACRFFFNAKPETHLEFDLGLAVRQDSENPVYYVQYAHARICSLIANLEEEGWTVKNADEVDLSLLNHESERDLIKQLSMLPEEIKLAARDYDPSRINRYVTELAARFHKFYSSCRIKGEEENILNARLKLADATRQVIRRALTIVGVTAPEKM